MNTFFKSNTASLVASLCDYGFTVILKEFVKVEKYYAGVSGTVMGGVINFFVCRYWVFRSGETGFYIQGRRYFITWLGNLVLNALGYYVLVHFTSLHYVAAKLIASLTVAFAYNYPLQKNYVFRNTQ